MAETIIPNILTHSFVSAKAQSSDATLVSKNEWNDGHKLTGGEEGQIITYNTTHAPDNIRFIDPPVYYTAIDTVAGSTALPLNVCTTAVTTNSPAKALVVLNVNVCRLSGAQDITFAIQLDATSYKLFVAPSTTLYNYSFSYLIELPTANVYSFRINIQGASNITGGVIQMQVMTVGC